MLTRDPPGVFPLHLAPIDRMFLNEDHDRFPMTSVIHFDFSGIVQIEALDQAVAQAQKRHPLLRAIIKPVKQNRICWVAATQAAPPMEFGTLGEPLKLVDGEAIDLHRQVGLRLWVQTGADRSRLTVQVHHACTDGTGIYRFLGDLLAVYASLTDPARPPLKLVNLDPRLLRQRRTKMADRAIHGTAWQFVVNGLSYAKQLLATRISQLRAPEPLEPGAAAAPFPGICKQVFDRQSHDQLRDKAAAHGAMLNDLLVAEFLRTIDGWNSDHGDRAGGKRIRVVMPSDLRDQADFEMPAANMTAYTFITRRRRECRDFAQLVASVRDETAQIKFRAIGKSFVDAVMFLEYVPKVWALFRSNRICMATATLSNIGDPTKRFLTKLPRSDGRLVCGNLTLEEISGVPPLRAGNNVTLAIFTYRRQLIICLRCDPYRFSLSDSQKLLERYVGQLRHHLD